MVDFARIISKLPDRYARGWHCFGLERNIKRGEITSLEAFGTELVAFRGEDGQIRAVSYTHLTLPTNREV